MIKPCTCTKGGENSSSKTKNPKRRSNSKPCKNCAEKTVIEENMLSSNNNMGVELQRVIGPCVNWSTATRGRQRAVRRARTSFTGENNHGKNVVSSFNGSDIGNAEDFDAKDQVPVSESEKLGVNILGRRFSDELKNIPIKKRRCLLVNTALANEALNDNDRQVDFSGISILAEVACESDMLDKRTKSPVSESQPLKEENGTVTNLSDTPEVQVIKVENGENTPSKDSSRFHWDLNTVMDPWECDDEQVEPHKGADVAVRTVCDDKKEEGFGIISQEPINNGGVKIEADINPSLEPKECVVEPSVIIVEKKEIDLNLLSEQIERENEINPNKLIESSVSVHEPGLSNLTGPEATTIHEPTNEKPEPVSNSPPPFNEMDSTIETQHDSSNLGYVLEAKIENIPAKNEIYVEAQAENENVIEMGKKDGEEKEDEDYEDGELRDQPIIDYWANEDEEKPNTTESNEQENHGLIEPATQIDEPLPPPPDGGFSLAVNELGSQPEMIRDDWANAEMTENEKSDFDEKLQNGWVLNGAGSSRARRATGWDRLPENSTKLDRDSSPLRFRRDPSSSRFNSRPRSFVRPRRSEEDENLDLRSERRVTHNGPRQIQRSRDKQQWSRSGPTRHRSPDFSAPSYAPSNSENATVASIAKVKSNGFVVAPDGTLVKASAPSTVCLSRERELTPQRFHHVGRSRETHSYRRPVITDVCSRRGGGGNNIVHRHVASPLHMSRSRSRTRSPNTWVRGRSPPCRAGPTYNVMPPHGARWVDERPVNCRRSPPPPRRIRGEEYYHHQHEHHHQVHQPVCNGYEMTGPHRRYERNFNDGFRPRNKMVGFQRRGSPRRFVDRSRPNEERDSGGFKFGRGGHIRNNDNGSTFKQYEMRECAEVDGDGDAEVATRRRLS